MSPRANRVPARTLTEHAARWREAADGIAAVEFALILPIMVTMLLGMTEVTVGVNMDRKLTLVSRSLADLSSRKDTLSTTEMSNVFTAASAVLQPYNSSTAQMVVSSVLVTKNGTTYTGTVDWSCGKNLKSKPAGAPASWDKDNLTTRAKNSNYTVPTGFQTSTSFILVETKLPYTPAFGYILTGTITLGETTPWPVRNASQVTGPSTCPS